jgi:hypothetical protein
MSRRRSYEDPLAKLRDPTWLVTEDMLGRPLEVTPLEPYADLRAIVNTARDKRMAEGWECDEIGRHSSGFFCKKDGVRQLVGVKRVEPGKSTLLPSGSHKALR